MVKRTVKKAGVKVKQVRLSKFDAVDLRGTPFEKPRSLAVAWGMIDVLTTRLEMQHKRLQNIEGRHSVDNPLGLDIIDRVRNLETNARDHQQVHETTTMRLDKLTARVADAETNIKALFARELPVDVQNFTWMHDQMHKMAARVEEVNTNANDNAVLLAKRSAKLEREAADARALAEQRHATTRKSIDQLNCGLSEEILRIATKLSNHLDDAHVAPPPKPAKTKHERWFNVYGDNTVSTSYSTETEAKNGCRYGCVGQRKIEWEA